MSEAQSSSANAADKANRVESYRIPKIPPFYRADPALWFAQAEGTLRTANITSEFTKADSVLAAFDYEVAASVRDLILVTPRPADIYERIKQRIISTFGPSPEANLRKLLKGQVLSDGKPSLILNRLRNLNDGKCDDAVIRSVFLEHLPSGQRAILASTGLDDLEMLAAVADKIAESTGSSEPAIAAGERRAPSADRIESAIKNLTAEMSKMNANIERLLCQGDRSAGSERRARATSRRRSKSRDASSGPNLCYAHRKYPDKPTSCKSWCDKFSTFKSGN